MEVSVEIDIAAPKERVWTTITDIEGAKDVISGILAIEVITKPKSGLVGLKWKETRAMFGKEAHEVMWITESKENEFYCTRAESHGSVYITKLLLKEVRDSTKLTMTFRGEPQTFLVKLLSACMGIFMKGSMRKMISKDLEDIKNHIEKA